MRVYLSVLLSLSLASTGLSAAPPLPSPEYVYKSADGSFTFDPHFVSQLDTATALDERSGKENSDHRYRRQRFGAAGAFATDWRYQLFLELSEGKAQVRDGFVAYAGLPGWWFVAGQFREYGSMDEQSSFIHLHFLERPYAMTAFQPLRNRGVGINPHGKDWSYQLGLFTDGTGEAGDEDGGWGISTRLHGQLYNDVATSNLLHWAVSARFREPGNGIARFRANGDEAVLRDPLVSTPVMRDTDGFAALGGEIYATEGPLSFLTEWRVVDVARADSSDPRFWGGSAQVAYVLTGEQREYLPRQGTFWALTPRTPVNEGGAGAWEVAARVQTLDLESAEVQGGQLSTLTLGVNWYPVWWSRVMVNYAMNRVEDSPLTTSDPQYLMTRLQVQF